MTIKELKEAIDQQSNVRCGNHVTRIVDGDLYLISAFEGDTSKSDKFHNISFLGEIETVCKYFGYFCILESANSIRIWK